MYSPLNQERVIELACYMCICRMEDGHRILALKNAFGTCYKLNNFISASHLCKRILDYQSKGVLYNFYTDNQTLTEEVATQYQKYYSMVQAKGTNAMKIEFESTKIGQIEEAAGFLCSGGLKPLQNPNNCVKCPYDFSTYEKSYEGKLCETCKLAKVGAETIGLKLYQA